MEYMRIRILILVGVAAAAQAQWLNIRDSATPRTKDGKPNLSAPAPRASNGKPDLSGVWQGEGASVSELMKILPGGGTGVAGGNGLGEDTPPLSFFNVLAGVKPEESPLRPEFRAAYEKRAAVAMTTPPPALCAPPPVPLVDSRPAPFKIVQTPKLTLLLYEADTVFRQIFTDGRKHPDDPQPSWLGYSVGHWQGDSLVVETIGLIPFGPLDIFGHPHSEDMRVTEQFQRREFGHMDVQVTIDDPKTYTKPFTYKIGMYLFPDTDLLENFCTEDEKDAAHMKR
jgi:hypothetical protein